MKDIFEKLSFVLISLFFWGILVFSKIAISMIFFGPLLFLFSYYVIKWLLKNTLNRYKKSKLILFPILFIIPVSFFTNIFMPGIYDLADSIPHLGMNYNIQSRVNVMIMFQVFITVPFLILRTIFKKSEKIIFQNELEKSAIIVTSVFLIQTLLALSYKFDFLIFVIPIVVILLYLSIKNYKVLKAK